MIKKWTVELSSPEKPQKNDINQSAKQKTDFTFKQKTNKAEKY